MTRFSKEDLVEARHTLGSRIKGRRLALGMTQQKLGDACGMGQGTVSKIETGKYDVEIKQLIGLARALRIDTSDLVDGIELPDPSDDVDIPRRRHA